MLLNKDFIVSETNELLLQASSKKNSLSLENTGLIKANSIVRLCRKVFRISAKPGYDREFLFLQAHLIDLLELNIELFDKRCDMYNMSMDSVGVLAPSEALKKMKEFFEEDLALYRERKRLLIESTFHRIVNAKDREELLEVKSYLISNVSLISYKTKQPYYF